MAPSTHNKNCPIDNDDGDDDDDDDDDNNNNDGDYPCSSVDSTHRQHRAKVSQ